MKRFGNTYLIMFAMATCVWTQSLLAADPYAAARIKLVDDEIVSAGIRNPRVIRAMKMTPRHEFVTPDKRELAYFDMALPIGHGQTISPPYVVAFMTAQLLPRRDDKVLEIGTGSGYQAAVLSPLVKEVYSIEIVEPLGLRAAETLQRLGYKNVHTKIGDGFKGWPEHAPFDKIIVTCSPEDIPQPLIDQLTDGGRMIIPVGRRFQQTLVRFTKKGKKLEREPLQATFFVPMTGQAEQQRQVKPDPSKPRLVHGSFENVIDSAGLPQGWYYVRYGRVAADRSAPAGKRFMRFANNIMGRSSHALQAFGVDGTLVQQLNVTLWVRARNARRGREDRQQAHAMIEFYGRDRAPLGNVTLGPWNGSFRWKQESLNAPVPSEARLAVIGVGLFGATGELHVDDVSVAAAD